MKFKPRLLTPQDVIAYTDKAWNREDNAHCDFIESKETDTQAVIVTELDRFVVAFAPTQSAHDVLTDCLAAYPAVGGGQHQGFSLALESIWLDLEPVLATAKKRGCQVVFTGHSLGGALALLAVYWARVYYGGVDAWAFTTGAPRAWAGHWADDVDTEFGSYMVRYERHGDPIPAMAPWGKPVGQTIKVGKPVWWWWLSVFCGGKRHLPDSYRQFNRGDLGQFQLDWNDGFWRKG